MTAGAGRRSSLAGPLGLALALAMVGCGPGQTIELVAVRGCGLEQEFSGMRVRVLGDFAPGGGSEIVLGPGEHGTIPALPEDATGVAAEGLFGTTVTAVGRSYGIDPERARGRIAWVDPEAAILAVYFGAPDSACELDDQPGTRAEAGAAAGPDGDVVIAGGIGADGELLDELVHVDLLGAETRTLAADLPQPRRGASVHALGGRRFVVIGGAGAGEVIGQPVIVDVDQQSATQLAAVDELARSEHASARSPVDGRTLLVGGCEAVDAQGSCDPASALASAVWLDPANVDGPASLPELEQARFGAHAAIGADGVAWVAGGFGTDGAGLGSVERLVPGGAWSTVHALAPGSQVAGLAVLDGGLILLSESTGAIHWWSEAGEGTLDPTSRAPALAPIAAGSPRSMHVLPGERVLIDQWLFSPATAAVDPAIERIELGVTPRSSATMLGLGDGSVLIAGGREVATGELASPPLWRLRPVLDGPDEWIPELTGPRTDAFVTDAPGRATVVVGGLRLAGLDPDGQGTDVLPPVRAHVRGFRSRALRLELRFEADADALAHVVVGQGSLALVALALEQSGVVARRRTASGDVEILACDAAGSIPSGEPLVLEIDDDGGRLRLDGPAGTLAICTVDWPSSADLAVGFGVSGPGSARFFGLRLARRQ